MKYSYNGVYSPNGVMPTMEYIHKIVDLYQNGVYPQWSILTMEYTHNGAYHNGVCPQASIPTMEYTYNGVYPHGVYPHGVYPHGVYPQWSIPTWSIPTMEYILPPIHNGGV